MRERLGSTQANYFAGANRTDASYGGVRSEVEQVRLRDQAGVIEIEFAAGGRMRITGTVEASTVSALIRALTKNKRQR